MLKLNPLGPNMTELELSDGIRVLFSYRTPVAFCGINGYFKTSKKWSVTTTRHINKWLNGAPCEVVEQSYLDELCEGVK